MDKTRHNGKYSRTRGFGGGAFARIRSGSGWTKVDKNGCIVDRI